MDKILNLLSLTPAEREAFLAAAPGVEHQGFLSAVTYQVSVPLWETVETQAGRVYELWDSYGLAHDLLAPILAAGLATGHQVVACPAARSSLAPVRVNTRSTTPMRAALAGTKEPIWAMRTMRATCRM